MAIEKEFLAMRAIDRAFTSLATPEDRERVVKWTVDKYSPAPKPIMTPGFVNQQPHTQQQPMNH